MLIKNRLTGSLWRELGTSVIENHQGVPRTVLWMQKLDQPRTVLPWAVDSITAGHHWYVAVDENGREQSR